MGDEVGSRTVAVTGASGFIGRRVLPLLQEQGYRLKILVHHNGTQIKSGMEQISGDICEKDAARRLSEGCGYLIHLAGIAHTDIRSGKEAETVWQTNVRGTENLLRAAQEQG